MEATSETSQAEDWLAGAIVEAGGDIYEHVDVPLEGLDLSHEDHHVA